MPSAQPTPSSSNLYLVTFLATLFLLLLVSCAIVLRSFLLRRRFRQQLEEAYAAGIILAPQTLGSRRRRYGHKPKLHTAWITDAGGEKWADMMPVSALPVPAKRRHKSKHPQPPSPPSSIWRFLPSTPRVDPAPVEPRPHKPSRLQVSVLIAMPSPLPKPSSFDKGSDDDLVPNVVFGATRLPYKSH